MTKITTQDAMNPNAIVIPHHSSDSHLDTSGFGGSTSNALDTRVPMRRAHTITESTYNANGGSSSVSGLTKRELVAGSTSADNSSGCTEGGTSVTEVIAVPLSEAPSAVHYPLATATLTGTEVSTVVHDESTNESESERNHAASQDKFQEMNISQCNENDTAMKDDEITELKPVRKPRSNLNKVDGHPSSSSKSTDTPVMTRPRPASWGPQLQHMASKEREELLRYAKEEQETSSDPNLLCVLFASPLVWKSSDYT